MTPQRLETARRLKASGETLGSIAAPLEVGSSTVVRALSATTSRQEVAA